MIRPCTPQDFDQIHAIINDGAQAYKDVIPADRFPDPYMSHDHLHHEIASGIIFYGYENPRDAQNPATLAGVMGIQHVHDVTLIRHAYVRTTHQKQGVGTLLLAYLRELTDKPILIGTWANASWAISFYQRHGFRTVSAEEKTRLLKRYWTIPDRQVETSVVLADSKWLSK
jgi:GNAT superfamily N-acetyltransferase